MFWRSCAIKNYRPMPPAMWVLLVIILACAGCDSTGSINSGGTDNAGYGRVKIGVPF